MASALLLFLFFIPIFVCFFITLNYAAALPRTPHTVQEDREMQRRPPSPIEFRVEITDEDSSSVPQQTTTRTQSSTITRISDEEAQVDEEAEEDIADSAARR
jgi:hypothetical protein